MRSVIYIIFQALLGW